MRGKRFYLLISMIIFVLFFANACSNPLQKKEPKKQGDSKETKEAPKDLKRLFSGADEVFDTLVSIDIAMRNPEAEQQNQQKGNGNPQSPGGQQQQKPSGGQSKILKSETYIPVQAGGGGQGGGGQGGQSGPSGGGAQAGGGGQGGGGGQQPANEAKPQQQGTSKDKMWQDVEDAVKQLHDSWNSFEPKTEEDDIDKDSVKGFEDELNKLAAESKDKKIIPSLEAANGIQQYFSEFISPYKEVVPPGLYKVKYYYQEAYVQSMANKWQEAQKSVEEASKEWKQVGPKLEEEDEELAKKMEFSITDLGVGIETQDINVVDMKFDIIKENLDAFEKKYKEKEKEEKEKKQ